ncbi:UNVERIFIED_CONTAM: hypothetical protein HHA_217720 [Hammondia hammondi]|eukprot:XP_008889273.1 hypothetical protein HHA_217720 [Hammondia hammondi]
MAFKGMCLAKGASSMRILRNALLLASFLSASLVPGVVMQREGTLVAAAFSPPRETKANFPDAGVGDAGPDLYTLVNVGEDDSFMLTGEQEQDEQEQDEQVPNNLVDKTMGYGGDRGQEMHPVPLQEAIDGENRAGQVNSSMDNYFYDKHRMEKRRAGRGRKSGLARRYSGGTRNRSTIANIAVQTIIAVGVLAAGATFALRQLAEVRRTAVDAEKAALLDIQRKNKEEAMKEKKVLEAEKSASLAQAVAAAKKPEQKPAAAKVSSAA